MHVDDEYMNAAAAHAAFPMTVSAAGMYAVLEQPRKSTTSLQFPAAYEALHFEYLS